MTDARADLTAHVLLVEADERLRQLLATYLRRHGFLVSLAGDGARTERLLSGLDFDLILLDGAVTDAAGAPLAAALRGRLATPILLLGAAGGDGGEALPKPFEPQALLDTANAMLSRPAGGASRPAGPRVLRLGPLRYDIERGEMWHGHERVRLTATESALMRLFSACPGAVLSRAQLVADLGRATGGAAQERAVDVQITRLRRKIEADPRQPRYLQTVRRAGYMLAPD